ncbi:MAG: methyltransferase domain-containing protein [Deltaproteobacteria bacterium]|nr:methyltransferase domain-containing protein [Deltaproteobacteria bacterium]
MLDHFDLIAPVYDRMMGYPDPDEFRRLLKLPTKGMLLDAGGGTGRASFRLRELTGGIVVSDLSLPMLRQARGKGPPGAVLAHAERLPFASETFARVLVVDALHHFCDQREAVADLVRVLNPGGRLVIEEPDIRRFPVKLAAAGEKLFLMRSRFHHPEVIQGMIRTHGLATSIRPAPRFSTWIVADKNRA